MSFRKFNFIIGNSASGKTLFLKKIAESIHTKGIFLDADAGVSVSNPNFTFYSVQNFSECSNLINYSIITESHFVVIDGLHSLTVPKGETSNTQISKFFKQLSDAHTYFFSMSMNKTLPGFVDSDDYFKNIKRSISFLINKPQDQIAVFETQKNTMVPTLPPFKIINHDADQSYNIGAIDSLIREYKINQLLC